MLNKDSGKEAHGIDVLIDGRCVSNHNDPSDAEDWLIRLGLPRKLFLKRLPDGGPSWEDMPLNFFWNCHQYTVKKAE